MALTRPVLLSTPAFDAREEKTFIFTVPSTSAQITANKLIVRRQSDNNIVYQEKQTSFRYEHILARNKLSNNTYYNASIVVYDADGNQSPESIPIQFYCYTTPLINFTNVPQNNIVQNASYEFKFSYTQVEGEKLNTYVVNLHNNSGDIIATSGPQYVENGTPPYNGSYLFAGMDNATAYSVEIIGTTVNDTIVTSGRYNFNVQYLRPDIFTLVELTNNCDDGYISVRSNIVIIEGSSNPSPPIYIKDKEVDLRDPNHWVKWDKGYSITGDFTAKLWFRDPNPNSKIIQFSNATGQIIEMYYKEGYKDVDSQEIQSYMEVYVSSATNLQVQYYIFSNFIDILPDDRYYNVWLRRKNDIYQVELLEVPIK